MHRANSSQVKASFYGQEKLKATSQYLGFRSQILLPGPLVSWIGGILGALPLESGFVPMSGTRFW